MDCLFGGLDQALCVASLALHSTHCFLRFVILIFIRTTDVVWSLVNHSGRSTTLAMYIFPQSWWKALRSTRPTLRRSVAGFFDDDDATPDENVENRIRIQKKFCSTNGQPLRKRHDSFPSAMPGISPPSSVILQPDLRPILDDYDIYFHDFYV